MTDSDRRQQFIDWFSGPPMNGDREALIRKSGLTKGRISQYFDPSQQFGERAARSLAGRLGLPEEFFNTQKNLTSTTSAERSDKFVEPPQPKAIEEPAGTPISGLPTIQVPTLANAASMGSGNDVLHDDVMIGTITLSADWVAKRIRPTSPSALRCMHSYGDSMSPTFEDGDILLVDTGAINPSSADGVYVLEANHRLFIKRVTERLGGGHDVTSDNPRVKTVSDLNGGHEVSVKGRVVWAWNGKKL